MLDGHSAVTLKDEHLPWLPAALEDLPSRSPLPEVNKLNLCLLQEPAGQRWTKIIGKSKDRAACGEGHSSQPEFPSRCYFNEPPLLDFKFRLNTVLDEWARTVWHWGHHLFQMGVRRACLRILHRSHNNKAHGRIQMSESHLLFH